MADVTSWEGKPFGDAGALPHKQVSGVSTFLLCLTGLLAPVLASQRLRNKKAELFSNAQGIKLVEKVHTFIAVNWAKFTSNIPLLNKVIEKAYQQFILQMTQNNVSLARFSCHPGVPTGFRIWGVDVGLAHSKWQSQIDEDSSDVLNYCPPLVPFSNRLKFWRNIASFDTLINIRNLLIEGALDDLHTTREKGDACFSIKPNQGLVLRVGYVFESYPHVAELCKTNPDSSPNKTYLAVDKLRSILPHALTNRGMLLVRVTNIANFPASTVTSTYITPAHKDDERYGSDIFSLSLWASSSLIFAKTRDPGCPPVCVWPDEFGTLSHFSDELRTDFYHYVPNNNTPRVSITWRPFTQADLAPSEDPMSRLCKMCFPNNTEPHCPCTFHNSREGQLV